MNSLFKNTAQALSNLYALCITNRYFEISESFIGKIYNIKKNLEIRFNMWYHNIVKPVWLTVLLSAYGGIAQLGERLNGIQEVSGSIPLISTKL